MSAAQRLLNVKCSQKMNPNQKKIPMVEFAVVKFEPVILESKRNFFPRKWKILRAGSEGVRLLGPRVQSFRPSPPRSLKNSTKRPVCESEMQSRI
jgi:hypothetical protein